MVLWWRAPGGRHNHGTSSEATGEGVGRELGWSTCRYVMVATQTLGPCNRAVLPCTLKMVCTRPVLAMRCGAPWPAKCRDATVCSCCIQLHQQPARSHACQRPPTQGHSQKTFTSTRSLPLHSRAVLPWRCRPLPSPPPHACGPRDPERWPAPWSPPCRGPRQ